jgi:hypothetical protein
MVHEWIKAQKEEMNKKIEQNNETIARLHVENTELTKVIGELEIIK